MPLSRRSARLCRAPLGRADERACQDGRLYLQPVTVYRCRGCGSTDLRSSWITSRWKFAAPLLHRVRPRYECLNDGWNWMRPSDLDEA
jgi:hypothetical protein